MTILVTGATANIGRKVVDHLLALGATDIRALTNNVRKAALPSVVQVAEGCLRRPDTLPAAFVGVERMYLVPTPDSVTELLALAVRPVCGMSSTCPVNRRVDGAVSARLSRTVAWPGPICGPAISWRTP